jgi:hypothetical protein
MRGQAPLRPPPPLQGRSRRSVPTCAVLLRLCPWTPALPPPPCPSAHALRMMVGSAPACVAAARAACASNAARAAASSLAARFSSFALSWGVDRRRAGWGASFQLARTGLAACKRPRTRDRTPLASADAGGGYGAAGLPPPGSHRQHPLVRRPLMRRPSSACLFCHRAHAAAGLPRRAVRGLDEVLSRLHGHGVHGMQQRARVCLRQHDRAAAQRDGPGGRRCGCRRRGCAARVCGGVHGASRAGVWVGQGRAGRGYGWLGMARLCGQSWAANGGRAGEPWVCKTGGAHPALPRASRMRRAPPRHSCSSRSPPGGTGGEVVQGWTTAQALAPHLVGQGSAEVQPAAGGPVAALLTLRTRCRGYRPACEPARRPRCPHCSPTATDDAKALLQLLNPRRARRTMMPPTWSNVSSHGKCSSHSTPHRYSKIVSSPPVPSTSCTAAETLASSIVAAALPGPAAWRRPPLGGARHGGDAVCVR